MGPGTSRRMRRVLGRTLDQVATVYTRSASTGAFDTVVKTGLACLLQPLDDGTLRPGNEREENADAGRLFFDAAYNMPKHVQLTVDAYGSVRWGVVEDSVWPQIGPGKVVVMNICEVRSQGT